MKPKHASRLAFPAFILAGSLVVPFAQAASQTWDGGSTVNGNWSTITNWTGDPAAPGATSGTTNTDVATFNAAIANTWGNVVGNPVVIDSTTQNIGGISFGGATGNYFIGSTGGNSLLLSSGGSIQILGSLTATNAVETINAPLIIQGSGGIYTLANNSSNGSGVGAGTLNFGGSITGGAAGATVLNLSGANTNTNTVNGVIADGSATSLTVTKSGSGTWRLTAANTYSGPTTINAGTLNLNRQTGSLNSAGALTFTGSGTFNMDNVGATGALTQSLGALAFSSGDGTVRTTRTAAFDQALTFSSLSARTAGASANFVNTGTNSATNGFVFTASPTAGQLIDRGYFYNGSSYAAYDAAGFVRAYTAGDANYLSVAGGVTMGVTSSTDNVALTGSITAQTTATVNTIDMGANSVTLSAAGQILSTNGLLSNGSTSATIGFAGTTAATTGVLQSSAAGNEMVIRVNGSTDKLTLNAIIQNFNAGATASSLTKTGAGTLVINDNGGNNTYTGNTFLNAGTVQLGSANVGSGTRNWFGTGTLTIADGASITTNSDPAKTVANAITLSGGYANLSSRDMLFTGKISGAGGVAVVGAGRWLNLSNTTNDFTGGIVFRSGGANNTLRVNAASVLGSGGIRVEGINNIFEAQANLSNGAGVANSIELASGGALTFNSNSVLLSGTISGAGSLSNTSTGTLTLSGANSYTGGTTVSAGVLTLSGSGNFGASTGTLTASGGTMDLAGGSLAAGTVNMTGGIIQNGTLNGTSYVGTSGFISANLVGTGALTMNSAGNRLVLSGNNTYSGSTTITAGTLRATGDYALPNYSTGTINVGASGTLQVITGEWNTTEIFNLLNNPSLLFASGGKFAIDTANGDFSNSTTIDIVNLGLTKLGANTLTLTGTNSYTQATTVDRGILKIDAGAGATLSASSPLIFSGTGKFDYDNTTATGAKAQSMGALTFSAGEGTVQVTRTAAQTVGLTFSSLAARTAGATRNFVLGGTPGVNGTDSKIVFTTGATANTFIDHGTFFGGSAYAWNDAGNFVRTIDYATDAGATTSGTAVSLISATHQQITGAIIAQNTANFTTLNISGNHNLGLAALQTVSVNGILKSGNTAGGAIITGGTGITTVTSGADMVVRTDGANDAVTISTPILANGASSLTKSGAGTLTLSSANTITGGVRLNAGQLNINNAAALGTAASRLTINDGTIIDNTSGGNISIPLQNPVTINGSFTYLGTSGDLSFPDNVPTGLTMVNDSTITVVNNTLRLGYSFNATSASLTKNGNGSLLIGNNGSANYSGGLTVNAGVVTGNFSQPNAIAGTGPLTLGATSGSSNAILATGAGVSHSNPITVRAGSTGVLAITSYSGAGTWGGPLILNNNLTLSATSGNSVSLSSVISGSGVLSVGNAGSYTISGTSRSLDNVGTVTISGINTFTGDTVMTSNSGTLQLGGLSALKNSTLDTGTSGGQQVTFGVVGNNTYNIGGLKGADALAIGANTISVGANGQSTSYNGILSGTLGGLTKIGSGTLTFTGPSTYSGGTIVNAGTLTGTGTSSLGATTGTLAVNNLNTGVGTDVVLNLSTTAATTTGSLSGAKATPSSGTNTATINIGGSQLLTVNQTSAGTYAGVIAGNGSLTLGGLSTNTLTLTGTNTYTGPTAVNAGSLLINGSNTGSGALSVAALATLGGTGSITGAVNVTGVLSPGASIQSLASGALNMNSASTFFYEAANNSATGADLMVVNGNLSLTGVILDLSAANLGLGSWVSGDKLTLISYTGTEVTTGFTGYTDDTTYTGGVFGSNQWVFNYNDTAKGANFNPEANGTSFVTLTAVPEPDVAMLVGGLGLMSLLFRRRSA